MHVRGGDKPGSRARLVSSESHVGFKGFPVPRASVDSQRAALPRPHSRTTPLFRRGSSPQTPSSPAAASGAEGERRTGRRRREARWGRRPAGRGLPAGGGARTICPAQPPATLPPPLLSAPSPGTPPRNPRGGSGSPGLKRGTTGAGVSASCIGANFGRPNKQPFSPPASNHCAQYACSHTSQVSTGARPRHWGATALEVATILRPAPSFTSHAQPEPNWPSAAALNFALNSSTLPNEAASLAASAGGGAPPPPGFRHCDGAGGHGGASAQPPGRRRARRHACARAWRASARPRLPEE